MSDFKDYFARRNHNDPVILVFHDSVLHKSDIELLKGPNWLNDLIISFYFDYLEKIMFQNYKNVLFVPPQVTQCIKMCGPDDIEAFLGPLKVKTRDFVFFALNDHEIASRPGGTHWSLLVYSKPENKLFHFDSMNGSNHNQAWEFGTKLLGVLCHGDEMRIFEEVHCLQQNNAYDCGIHLICNTENVAQHAISKTRVAGACVISERGVFSKRDDMMDLIESLYNEGYRPKK